MIRLYRLLLHVFPRAMRRDFGDEMVQMFEAQLRETRASRGSIARLWLLAIGDGLVHGGRERAAQARLLTRRMTSELRRCRRWCRTSDTRCECC